MNSDIARQGFANKSAKVIQCVWGFEVRNRLQYLLALKNTGILWLIHIWKISETEFSLPKKIHFLN